MVKHMVVDVEASFGWQENGRLRPSDKKEYANKGIKKFVCPDCNYKIEISKKVFGEGVLCEKCGSKMIQQV